MSENAIEVETSHYYVIQRRWNSEWVDSSGNYHGEDGLPAAMQCEAQMAATHGIDQVKMVRRDTVITQIEITTDVHTEHCCWQHGCEYGGDETTCTVLSGLRPQSHMCEQCDTELYENGGWELAELLNEMYDKGFKHVRTCALCKCEPVSNFCYGCN